MTDQSWEILSNQFVAVAGVLYFLALISILIEWASLRRLPAEEVVTTGRTAGTLRINTLGMAASPGSNGIIMILHAVRTTLRVRTRYTSIDSNR